MPIYEYYCERCDNRFEKLRPMSAAGLAQTCPSCGSPAPAAVSRTARLSGQAEGAAGEDDAMSDTAGVSDFGGGHGHSHGGHGHSHGPMGHTH